MRRVCRPPIGELNQSRERGGPCVWSDMPVGEAMNRFLPLLSWFGVATVTYVIAGFASRARRASRYTAAGALAAAVLALGQTAAYAEYSQSSEFVFRTANAECTHGHGRIDNTTAVGGHIDARTTDYIARSVGGTLSPCAGVNFLAAGLIAVQEVLFWHDGSNWQVCNVGGVYANQTRAEKSDTGWDFRVACGIGWYALWTGHAVQNGGWNGGWLPAGSKAVYVCWCMQYG